MKPGRRDTSMDRVCWRLWWLALLAICFFLWLKLR